MKKNSNLLFYEVAKELN